MNTFYHLAHISYKLEIEKISKIHNKQPSSRYVKINQCLTDALMLKTGQNILVDIFSN